MRRFTSTALVASLACVGSASAAVTTADFSWSVSTAIPDNNSSGLVSTKMITVDIASIDYITVSLEIEGGWNGDYYAYLQHDTGFSVLLNRPGRTAAKPAGSASSGMSITIGDTGILDTHSFPNSGVITGSWQPDGRAIDPSLVLDSTVRTALLSDFSGINPNGTWTLFVADLATGDQGTLTSWGITITGEAVPEPSTPMVLSVTLLAYLSRRRREH